MDSSYFLPIFCEMFLFVLSEGSYHSPVRHTEQGQVRGKRHHVEGGHVVEKYLGIPYAQPPVGPLRFKYPAPPLHRTADILDATVLPPACLQSRDGVQYIEVYVPGFNRTSENCLYLNIYVPVVPEQNRKLLPVMVFIHGGSYRSGMGAMFDGTVLATYGVVVVTFNYRLGPLGFLSAADPDIPGNYGLFDQLEVLKWVNTNIKHFDGDPDRVTVDGHSAGGCSVGILSVSPLAKGLFNRVIGQSGSIFANWAMSRHQTRPSFYFRDFTVFRGMFGNTTKEIKNDVFKTLHPAKSRTH
ncbi:hypothetical protein ScPMuIL_000093 [Solemya velum]